jgi:hypothetical protein
MLYICIKPNFNILKYHTPYLNPLILYCICLLFEYLRKRHHVAAVVARTCLHTHTHTHTYTHTHTHTHIHTHTHTHIHTHIHTHTHTHIHTHTHTYTHLRQGHHVAAVVARPGGVPVVIEYGIYRVLKDI